MCGIAGYFVAGGEAEERVVRQMNDRIVHRGPDEDGYWTGDGCGLGMRRLSIIDLAGGRQPIANEDESAWIVFNGEIYNYRELREELQQRGHRFRTATDTEVILHLWEDEGEPALEKLRGMFALAIWDRKRKQLFLARDRFGKKPLHYCFHRGALYFASELKSLRGLGLPLEVDREALQLYFRYRYIPEPRSIFKAVKKVPAGGWLRYDASGKREEGIYWQLPAQQIEDEGRLDRRQAGEELRHLFDESVRMRMVADVPLGAFLSAGIDSGSVVAAMAKQSGEPVRTFSIGFVGGGAANETEGAARVARQYGCEHHEIEVAPDSVALMERIGRYLDEPFGDSSAIPTLLVSEFARQHVKVVLSGDGGDELFQGYDSFFAVDRLRQWDAWPQALRTLAGAVGGLLPYQAPGKNFVRMISRPSAWERYLELNHVPTELRRRLVGEGWDYAGGLDAEDPWPGKDILAKVVEFEATWKLAGDMLVKVDRMSMAASIEVRCPLLDHKLAEFARKIPARWNLREGVGKSFFRDVLGDRLPPENLNLPKRGFGVPLAKWFREEAREFLVGRLFRKRFLERGIVRESFVRYIFEEHQNGRRDNYHLLWMLLMLGEWLEQWEGEAGFRL
ncbi:MAG: asparagine synthase (glutamine-hydrolyzing) [Bryobacter sp.]|nr:asparagine synthase (glutamine-hydrolyzing) [Bryobacter sp.]